MYGAGQPESAITRVVSAFKVCLSDTEVLRTIDDFFGDLGFEFDPEAEERNRAQGVGQRRSRAAGYLETLDLSQDGDRDRLLSAVATKLAEWDEKHGPSSDRLTRLHRTLKTTGFEWDGTDIVPRARTKAVATTTAAAAEPVVPAEPLPDAPSVFISYAHEDRLIQLSETDRFREEECKDRHGTGESGGDLADRPPQSAGSQTRRIPGGSKDWRSSGSSTMLDTWDPTIRSASSWSTTNHRWSNSSVATWFARAGRS